jgi:hypothetical protein
MSKPTPDYVRRALARLVENMRAEAVNTVTAIRHRNNAVGRLESGATIIESNEAMLALMKTVMRQGAELTFNAFEEVTREGTLLLMDFGQSLADVLAVPVIEWAKVGGSIEALKRKFAGELRQQLDGILYAELDDFSHGMHGGARLSKEPVVANIINNTMTNSPGAVQQAGVGDFSQTAFTQQTANLVKAIDILLASDEFQKLDDEKRSAVGDVADALKHEAR